MYSRRSFSRTTTSTSPGGSGTAHAHFGTSWLLSRTTGAGTMFFDWRAIAGYFARCHARAPALIRVRMDTNFQEKRLAIGLDEAARRVGVSRRHIELRIQAGELR